ncbi:hypothetical protein [Burkholderia sp. AW49-1]
MSVTPVAADMPMRQAPPWCKTTPNSKKVRQHEMASMRVSAGAAK